jgi:hypothetical protein
VRDGGGAYAQDRVRDEGSAIEQDKLWEERDRFLTTLQSVAMLGSSFWIILCCGFCGISTGKTISQDDPVDLSFGQSACAPEHLASPVATPLDVMPILYLDYGGFFKDPDIPVPCDRSYELCNPVSIYYDSVSHLSPLPAWVDSSLHVENNAENWQEPGRCLLGPEVEGYPFDQENSVYFKASLDYDDRNQNGYRDRSEPEFWVYEYWYYYAYNSPCCGPFAYHEHDWEWVYVVLDSTGATPLYALLSAHDDNSWDSYEQGRMYAIGDEILVDDSGKRVLAQVYAGSHAMGPVANVAHVAGLHEQRDFEVLELNPLVDPDIFYYDDSSWRGPEYEFSSADIAGDPRFAPWLRAEGEANTYFGVDESDEMSRRGDPLPPEFHPYSPGPSGVFADFTADVSEDGVELSWAVGPSADVYGFNVWRSELDERHFTLLNRRPVLASGDELGYCDDGVEEGRAYFYRVEGLMRSGPSRFSRTEDVYVGLYADGLSIVNAHPNPFAESGTIIEYEVIHSGQVSVRVYDLRGALVRELVDARKESGRYSVEWDGVNTDGEDVSGGVYFCRLDLGGREVTRKLVRLR